jgi:hypothetical protein
MFLQLMTGKVTDAEALLARGADWARDLRPGAVGFLGSTLGVTPDGTAVLVARFDSVESARANSDRVEQGAWWAGTAHLFEGDVHFLDCPDCDVMRDGGSDDAGFVQVMTFEVTDRERMRSEQARMEPELARMRPDVIGGIAGWHDRTCVQVMYFTDEESARAGEKGMAESSTVAEWQSLLAGPPTFYDLRDPQLI